MGHGFLGTAGVLFIPFLHVRFAEGLKGSRRALGLVRDI